MPELFTDVPCRDMNAYLHERAGDSEFVYHGQVIPPGYDAEADRLRSLGRVQVFRFRRPVKTVEVDRELYKLVRRKG